MNQAVAHAEHATGAEETSGTFDSGWQDNWQATFIVDAPAKVRYIATISIVTMAEVPDLA
jgi:hypothetical protein